jgi:ribulose-5-phosphate 4-epimerase/fuculose-1-phosphate aldolase
VKQAHIEAELLMGCRRLSTKGFLNTPSDSFSLRVPGNREMIFAMVSEDWREISVANLQTVPLSTRDGCGGLHAAIYRERDDVGALVISSPKGARILADCGRQFPTLFDEQARHIGPPADGPLDDTTAPANLLKKVLKGGTNAVLLGKQLLCLGMNCERVLCNTELYEKCAQAYVIATASGYPIRGIPGWVRFIANRRLLRDQRRAAASYREGVRPEGICGY